MTPRRRQNTVNKMELTEGHVQANTASVYLIQQIMDERDAQGLQRGWTPEELQPILKREGVITGTGAIGARIRDLRKPAFGQFPCIRALREHTDDEEPLIYEYTLGEAGTGVLGKEVECEQCTRLEAKVDQLNRFIARYQQLVSNLKEDLGWNT